jgi:hypothetical protein
VPPDLQIWGLNEAGNAWGVRAAAAARCSARAGVAADAPVGARQVLYELRGHKGPVHDVCWAPSVGRRVR